MHSTRRRISAVVLLLALAAGGMHLADLDDRLWYHWQNHSTPEEVKNAAIWLPEYRADRNAFVIPGVEENASGITFDHDRHTLWVVVNQPPMLVELDLSLRFLRRIHLEGFRDTEAVTYLGEGVFAICDERSQTVVLAEVDDDTVQIDKQGLKQLTINLEGSGNKGLEGIAVDAGEGCLYAVRERDPMRLMRISGLTDQRGAITIETPGPIEVTDLYMDDLSGLHFDHESSHLLVLSDESQLLAEIDLQGDKVSYMDLQRGFNGLTRSIPQPEGVTIDHEGRLYVVSEPNLIFCFSKGALPLSRQSRAGEQ